MINEKKLKEFIRDNDFQSFNEKKKYIINNPDNLLLPELSRLFELVNNNRTNTSAYYTDNSILMYIERYLPIIDKEVIRVLEPSVGVGNFLELIIERYSYAKKLIIEVNDIDRESLKILKLLNSFRKIPKNVEIVYHNKDFLDEEFLKNEKFDLIVGNPPFQKLKSGKQLKKLQEVYEDNDANNLAAFFIEKSITISDYVILIEPKYFLSNSDFRTCREKLMNHKLDYIIDFGERGFKGVKIETISLFINTKDSPNKTRSISVPKNYENYYKQEKLVDPQFPGWLIYKNSFFEELSKKLIFNIFDVYRDRQVTNSILLSSGEIPVIKSRNISRDGSGLISLGNYDSFINRNVLNKLQIKKYYHRNDVFLAPNMTYYPRVIRKPRNVITNGSVAILENKTDFEITDEDLKFFSSKEFEEFYSIARNFSTRSLNLDKNSIVFFGILKELRNND